jgi:hypothetical protein
MDIQRLRQLGQEIRDAFKTEEGRSYWIRGMVKRGDICQSEAGYLYIELGMGTVNA